MKKSLIVCVGLALACALAPDLALAADGDVKAAGADAAWEAGASREAVTAEEALVAGAPVVAAKEIPVAATATVADAPAVADVPDAAEGIADAGVPDASVEVAGAGRPDVAVATAGAGNPDASVATADAVVPDAAIAPKSAEVGEGAETTEGTEAPKPAETTEAAEMVAGTEEPAPAESPEPAPESTEEPAPVAAPAAEVPEPSDALAAETQSGAAYTASDGASDSAQDSEAPPIETAAPSEEAPSAQPAEASALTLTSVKAPTVGSVQDQLRYFDNNAVYLISTACAKKDQAVLDVEAGSTKSGANVQIYERNATLAQYWRAVYRGSGIYQFVSEKSGKMLTYAKAKGQANVTSSSGGNNEWRVARNADGTYTLAPAGASKLCLDVEAARTKNATNVWVYEANGTPAQKFFFTKSEGLSQAYAAGKGPAGGVVEVALKDNEALRVDIDDGSIWSGANAQLGKDSKSMAQKYQMSYVGNGLYELRNVNSGKCLDVYGGSTLTGANVQQYERNQTLAQYWYLEPFAGGYTVKSAASGLALTAQKSQDGANLAMKQASASEAQRFVFKGAKLIDDGTYVLQSTVVSSMVLDVYAGSKANKANVQIYRSNGTDAQRFKIRHIGGGYYTIQNVKGGKYVDVSNGSTVNGANIWMYAGNGTAAQKWKAEIGPNGLMFKSQKSGKYLDVCYGQPQSGTNVMQHYYNGSLAQGWVLHEGDWTFYGDADPSGAAVLRKAETYEGWPYKWGGRSEATSFDCTGLVMHCTNAVWKTGFDVMYTNASRLYNLCTPIKKSEAKVGDLVFYRGTYGRDVNYISHVVFYAGHGVVYGAGDPIGYDRYNVFRNILGQRAAYLFARVIR